MKIPLLNINIDPRTPQGQASIGSIIRSLFGMAIGLGLFKGVTEDRIDSIVAGAIAVCVVVASLKWSQASDQKLVDKVADGADPNKPDPKS